MEPAARWGLTLLLVALVGVMAASARYYCSASHWTSVQNGQAYRRNAVFISRGRSVWESAEHPATNANMAGYRDLTFGVIASRQPEPFAFFRAVRTKSGWSISLTYPALAAALPAAFLWYRHISRRRRRGACTECGYDLAGLAAVEERIICPECGAANAAGRVVGRATMLKASTP